MIPKEPYRVGDNIKALIIGVNKEKGPLLVASRTSPDYLSKLLLMRYLKLVRFSANYGSC